MDMYALSVFLKSAPQEWDIVHIGTEEGVEVYMDFPDIAEAVEFKLKYL
jgi:hypothetical protein